MLPEVPGSDPLDDDRSLRYDDLRERSARALHEGRVQEALAGFAAAARLASEQEDPDVVAIALANLTQASIESGSTPPSARRVREALTGCRQPLGRYLCARSLASIYLENHDLRKASFYARVAHQVAPVASRPAADQALGVVLLARTDWRGALPYLRRALDAWPHQRAPVVVALSLFAYLWSLAGDRRQAKAHVDNALDDLGELEGDWTPSYREGVHLSLGFALLEAGEPEGALHHAEETLRVSSAPGSARRPHEHKMALYLAAEAALDAGQTEAGEHYLDQLHRTHYPGLKDFRDLLLAVRTSGVVNWLA